MDHNEGIGHLSCEELQSIVDEINLYYDRPICIGNAKGYIVASYHGRSTGWLHQGFVKVLEEGLDELFLYEDNILPNILAGVNYPLVVGNKVMGTIGVTGKVEEIKNYSILIKILIEQVVQSLDSEHARLSYKRMYDNFLYEWLLETAPGSSEDFQSRGRMLGINVEAPRYVAVLDIKHSADDADVPGKEKTLSFRSEASEQLADKVRDFLTARDAQHCSTIIGNTCVLLLRQHSDDTIRQTLSDLRDYIVAQLQNVQCFIGVGMLATTKEDVRNSYHQARLASSISSQTRKRDNIVYYGTLDLQLLVFSAPQRYKRELFNRVFAGFSKEEIRDMIELIHTYIAANGSLKRCAEALFIHKNSLQYRLNRFARQTGYDLRNLSDISFLAALASVYDMGMD